jgi:hypothetical protein
MIQRKLFVIAVFVLIASACSPLLAPTLDGAVIVSTETSTPIHVSPTASPLPAPDLIPITSGPHFTLTGEARCYAGPGLEYDFVLILQAGKIGSVIGRNQESTWWRISPDTTVHCWVADEWGTFVGEAALIPITSSQSATQGANPISPTQTRKKDTDEEETSAPQSTQPARPTNPPPVATQPPPATEPPPATDPPATEPPAPTEPPAEPPDEPTPEPIVDLCQLLCP